MLQSDEAVLGCLPAPTPDATLCPPAAPRLAGGAGLDELARALTAYEPERLAGRGNDRAADRSLRTAARLLAAEARAADPLRAEQLLIALRQAWRALPAVERLPDDGPRRAVWDRLVLLCCEEFYAAAGTAAAPASGVTA